MNSKVYCFKFREFMHGENKQNDIVEIHIMSLKVATLQLMSV